MPVERVYADYLAAVRAGSRREALAVLDRACDQGLDAPQIYLHVLQPTLREIGRLWQENEISVADEHLATAITQSAMARLFERALAGGKQGGPTLIAACADVERHEIGLRMVCDLLELEGWDTVYLGGSVPNQSLVDMVQRLQPDAVALSASLAPHLPRLRAMIQAVREGAGDRMPLIVVGGRPFLEHPQLAAQLGADLTATDAAEAVQLLQQRLAA